MDTRTGQIVNLNESKARQAQMEWFAWQAGLTKEMPRYAPIKDDKMPVRPKRRKTVKRRRSYKDFCNG